MGCISPSSNFGVGSEMSVDRVDEAVLLRNWGGWDRFLEKAYQLS